MRERLEDLGLVTFCKTTGGKGLHVVAALFQPGAKDRVTWNRGKSASRRRSASADGRPTIPSNICVNMSKKAAHGTDLPRLSAQRPDVDGRRPAVATRTRGRHRLDAADVDASAWRSRSEEVHGAHRAVASGQEQGVGWL